MLEGLLNGQESEGEMIKDPHILSDAYLKLAKWTFEFKDQLDKMPRTDFSVLRFSLRNSAATGQEQSPRANDQTLLPA